jgi:hypothetical protein
MFGAEPKLKSLIKKEAREPSRCFLKSGVYIYKPFGCFRLPSAAFYVKGRENFIHAYNRLKDSLIFLWQNVKTGVIPVFSSCK